jgi:Cd2+/Zn2+-exporting ATPase
VLDTGTIFTLVSLLLLVAATIATPDGIINSAHAHTWLYLAAALVGSVYIWWSAIQGIRERDFTADIPVSFATAAALIIGQYSAAAVVAVLLLGGMLEEFVSARAGNALDSLASLLPDRVTVRRDGEDLVVPLEEVQSGDLVLIRSGDRIPVDGTISLGSASVNQAAITGESLPVDKRVSDLVYAGTLNEVGALEVRATRVGTETTLGQIRRMAADAQEQKAPIERILNRYAKFYTPAALLLGAVVWWISGDILRAITILIVFCPCVMVLATPTALVASIGNAALRGSLVKKGATIEAMANVTAVAFDKTGTLTFGQPKLTAIQPEGSMAEGDLLRLAASAEKLSEHPLGRAVVQAAIARELAVPDPEEFTTLPGLGVRARIDNGEVVIGRPLLLSERGISDVHAEVLPAQKVEIVKQLQAEGLHVAFVGDGVNDGPVLATANVGVAMGLAGTDVAIETSEIALLSDDLAKLPHLLSLSRRAMRAIKQNLIFSLSVLAIAVSLAIPGILLPVTGALLHELSSLPVIANSARLIGTKEQAE